MKKIIIKDFFKASNYNSYGYNPDGIVLVFFKKNKRTNIYYEDFENKSSF